MSSRKFVMLPFLHGLLCALALVGQTAHAQNTITTVAGGGPNNDGSPAENLCFPNRFAGLHAGNWYVVTCNRIYSVTPQGQWTAVAGTGEWGYGGDGGAATSAKLGTPLGGFVDSLGNIFIADTDNNRIREVVAATGVISTVAGGGSSRVFLGGDGGPALSASIVEPKGLFVDGAGNIFIAESRGSRIREVSAATGNIQTVAGIMQPSASSPVVGYNGDGIPATSAKLFTPQGVFADGVGNIFIADYHNNRVREIVKSTGLIQTIAGTGTSGYSGEGMSATSAELFQPSAVFVDGSGNIFIADTGNGRIREVSGGVISTIAGNGNAYPPSGAFSVPYTVSLDGAGNLFVTDGIGIDELIVATNATVNLAKNVAFGNSCAGGLTPASTITFSGPTSVSVDASGNIFFAGGYCVQELVAATGAIKTMAGNGTFGFSGDGGPATSAQLSNPSVFVDEPGNIFIADSGNSRVREVLASTGNIQTVAGNGSVPGFNFTSGPATAVPLNSPQSLFVDSSGNIFIADDGYGQILEVVAATGMIQSVVGMGNFVSPMGLFLDGTGNIYIADTGDNRVLKVDAVTGTVQTIAGSPSGTAGFSGDGGPATSALFNFPNAIVVDGSGNVFISDGTNHRIREVFAGSGIIQTVAGSGVEGFAGDGGPATSAQLNYPSGLTIGLLGNLIIADANNARVRSVAGIATPLVRAVTLSTASIVFPAQIVSTASAAQSTTITDFGKLSVAITSIPTITGADASDFAIQNGTTTCTNGATLTQNNSCTITLTFTPSGPGSRTASLSIFDNAFGSPQTVSLSGTGAPVVTLSPNSFTFSSQSVSSASASQKFTLTNNGSKPLAISNLSITGTNSGDFQKGVDTCGSGLPAGGTCTIPITFDPMASGSRSAQLRVSDNASGSPQTASLKGNGVDISLVAATRGATSATLTAGQTATYNLQIMPSGFSGTVSLSCSGAPAAAACSVVPTSISLSGSAVAPFTVTVTTTARSLGVPGGSLFVEPRMPRPLLVALFFVALLGTLGTFRTKVRLRFVLPALLILFAASVFEGCGGGPKPSNTGTPTGTSSLTVNASSNSVSRTLQLSLTVN